MTVNKTRRGNHHGGRDRADIGIEGASVDDGKDYLVVTSVDNGRDGQKLQQLNVRFCVPGQEAISPLNRAR